MGLSLQGIFANQKKKKVLSYYGRASSELSYARSPVSVTSFSDLVIGGGGIGATASNLVEAYNANLTKSSLTNLIQSGVVSAFGTVSTANVKTYVMFMGGSATGSANPYTTVTAYNTSLTRIQPTSLSQARNQGNAIGAGDYLLAVGGYTGSVNLSSVEAYNSSLTKSTVASLSQAKSHIAGYKINNIGVVVAGTVINSASDIVETYDSSLTKSTLTNLNEIGGQRFTIKMRNHLLIAGGHDRINAVSSVYAYNDSLTRTSLNNLSVARKSYCATTECEFPIGMVICGQTAYSLSGETPYVDVYGEDLTHTTFQNHYTNNGYGSYSGVGDKIIMLGGYTGSADIVDVSAYQYK